MSEYHDDFCDCMECEARRRYERKDEFYPTDEEMDELTTCPSRKEIKERAAKEVKMASEIKKESSLFKTPDEIRLKELKQELDSTLRYSFPWLTLQQKYRDLYVKIYGDI